MTKFEEIFECHNWRECATGIRWAEGRVAAILPIMHRIAPMTTPPQQSINQPQISEVLRVRNTALWLSEMDKLPNVFGPQESRSLDESLRMKEVV